MDLMLMSGRVSVKNLMRALTSAMLPALLIFAACGNDPAKNPGPVPEEPAGPVQQQSPADSSLPQAGDGVSADSESLVAEDGTLTLSRQDFASRLAAAVTLEEGKPKGMDEEEKAGFLEEVQGEVGVRAAEIFPERVEMRSRKVLEAILSEALVVPDPTLDAARVSVRLWLYECHCKLELAERIPPVSPEDEKALLKNVHDLWDGLDPLLHSKLKGLLDEKYINMALEETKAEHLAMVTDPTTPFYKQPVSDAEVAAIVEDFAHIEEKNPMEYQRAMGTIGQFSGPGALPQMKRSMNDYLGSSLGRQLIIQSMARLSYLTRAGEVGDLKVQLLHPDYEEVQKERYALLDEYNEEQKRRRKGTSDEKIVL